MKTVKKYIVPVKIAKEIALTSFSYVTDSILGVSDLDYSLNTSSEEFHQNFDEDLTEKGYTVNQRNIDKVSKEYDKLREKYVKALCKILPFGYDVDHILEK